MILSDYDFPSCQDLAVMEELGASDAEQCRVVVVEGDGRARIPRRDKGDRRLRLRHPEPMAEAQAVEELLAEPEGGHRVVEIMIYAAKPSLSELGIQGDPALRLTSHQRWFYRLPAPDGHIVGEVEVFELWEEGGVGGTYHYAPLRHTLSAHHVSPSGELNVITLPGMDAWVDALIAQAAGHA